MNQLPEIFFSSKKITNKIAWKLKQGNLRKISPRLYTTNLKDSPEYIIKKHLWTIVSGYFPDDFKDVTEQLARTNVFYDPNIAGLEVIHLRIE